MGDWPRISAEVQDLVEGYPLSLGEAYFDEWSPLGEFEAGWSSSSAFFELASWVIEDELSVLFLSWRVNALKGRFAQGNVELWEGQDTRATIAGLIAGLGYHPLVLHAASVWPRRWKLSCGDLTIDSSKREPRTFSTHLLLPAWLNSSSNASRSGCA